jgi:hypothetical protein
MMTLPEHGALMHVDVQRTEKDIGLSKFINRQDEA